MTTDKPKSTRGPGLSAAAIVVVVLALGTAAFLGMRGRTSARADHLADVPVFTVKRGPLTISVTESGTIKSREQVIIKSEVEGTTTIISLTPEGTRVKQGDLLVELDVSRLQDSLIDQQIRVENTEAAFIRARESLAVVENQAKSDVARAELDYQFAKEDLTKYVEGEYPNQRMEADTKVTLADEELKRAEDKKVSSEQLLEKKYLSETECDADRLAYKRAKLAQELAEESLKLLEKWTHKRKLDELKAAIDQKNMAQDRVKRKASADLVQAEADLKAKQAEFAKEQGKLDKNADQIRKTKIYASAAGMVVYATSAQGSWRGNAEPLDEGQSVHERQDLIYLPTAGSMMAQAQVHESSLDKIRPGLAVQIRIDAISDQSFTGRVTRIAPLPDAQSMWLNPDLKVYDTTIKLDGQDARLRTGMSCEATIVVEQYEDVLYVPVQAVTRRGEQAIVFVVNGDRPQPRAVQIGLDNNSMVHIKSGLEVGELVLVTPPLNSQAQSRDKVSSPEADYGAASAKAEEPSSPSEGPPRDESARGERGRQEMTPQQREEMRKRFENMSEEEREKIRQQFRQRGRQRQDGAAAE